MSWGVNLHLCRVLKNSQRRALSVRKGCLCSLIVPELLSFCLDCKKLSPDIESDLELSDFVRICFQRFQSSGSMGFMGNFTASFPVSSIDSLDKFYGARKRVFGLFVVDHVVFDTIGESIVSLSAECCFAPLNACG